MRRETSRPRIGDLVRRAWLANRALTVMGTMLVLTLVVTVPLIFLDGTQITGVRAWVKPTKFAISGAIYAFTFLWILSLIHGHRRLVNIVSWITAGTFMLEMVIIVVQVLRGTTSHFNFSTALDGTLFGIMGAAITIFWSVGFIAAVLLLRQRMDNKALAAGIRAGLIVALIGMALGFLMVRATPGQIAANRAGRSTGIIGAHTVGLDDGGPGLPLLNWSTKGGDLRVPHFFGLHALQVLTLVGWVIGLRASRLGGRRAAALVWSAAAIYLGLVGVLTWQALRGQSVVSPDAQTLVAFGLLLVASANLTLLVLRAPNAPRPSAAEWSGPGSRTAGR